jgi:hypothetical protein
MTLAEGSCSSRPSFTLNQKARTWYPLSGGTDQMLDNESSLVADMYGRWTLDCVIEVARSVSLDLVSRPRHYRGIPMETATALENFKALVGNHPYWPDQAQRAAIYGALIGDSDGRTGTDRTAQFHHASNKVRAAAIKYAERVYDTGEEMLRNAFLDAVVTLKSYLNQLQGRSVTLGNAQTRAIFQAAVGVLSDQEVARVFGLQPAPGGNWPLAGVYDGNGAYLLEEITRVLHPTTAGLISQRQFIVMQRITSYGWQTIAWILGQIPARDDQLNARALIQIAYSWATALSDLDGTTAAGPRG